MPVNQRIVPSPMKTVCPSRGTNRDAPTARAVPVITRIQALTLRFRSANRVPVRVVLLGATATGLDSAANCATGHSENPETKYQRDPRRGGTSRHEVVRKGGADAEAGDRAHYRASDQPQDAAAPHGAGMLDRAHPRYVGSGLRSATREGCPWHADCGSRLVRWVTGVVFLAVVTLAYPSSSAGHARPIAVAATNQSFNWSGYMHGRLEKGTTFHSIAATWIVPTATLHRPGEAEYSS